MNKDPKRAEMLPLSWLLGNRHGFLLYSGEDFTNQQVQWELWGEGAFPVCIHTPCVSTI